MSLGLPSSDQLSFQLNPAAGSTGGALYGGGGNRLDGDGGDHLLHYFVEARTNS